MKCLICEDSAKHTIDGIHLCGDCNLTLLTGSRDSMIQTLRLLERLAKAEAELRRIAGSTDVLKSAIMATPTSVIYNSYEAQKFMRTDCATEAAFAFAKIVKGES